MGTQPRSGIRAATMLQVRWAAMLALTSVATVVALMTTPFSAEEGEFFHALRSGEVSSVAVGHSADFYDQTVVNPSRFNQENDVAVSWVNRFGFRREAVLVGLESLGTLPDPNADAGGVAGAGADGNPEGNPNGDAGAGVDKTTRSKPPLDPSASIVRTAQSLGVVAPLIVFPGDLPFDHLKWLSLLATVIMIWIMLDGPQPRRTTKWGAFWAYLIPFHVGVFYVLFRDSPWNRRMNLLPEPRPGLTGHLVDPVTGERFRRYGGWAMFLWAAVLARFAISLVLFGIAGLIPTFVDQAVWSAVDMTGKAITP